MHKLVASFALGMFFVVGCGGQTTATNGDDANTESDGATSNDAPTTSGDAVATSDSGSSTSDAGGGDTLPPVRRLPCVGTSGLATDLPANAYGALEAELVSIVPPDTHTFCPNDTDHVHLQVEVGTKRYDIAITVNDNTDAGPMFYYEHDLAPSPLDAGWNGVGFDYVRNLGVHSGSFTASPKAAIVSMLQTTLADVSTLTIHGHAYTDGTGAHNVHYNHGGKDGVLLLHGKGDAGADLAIAFRFVNDSF
jgi:hypothetical protein